MLVKDGNGCEPIQREHPPFHKDVLVPDDSVANAVRFRLRSPKLQDEIARDDGALELERHVRRREELLRRPDVVHQAGERVRLDRGRGLGVLPFREVRLHERRAVHEDAVAMVERLLVELLLRGTMSREHARR